eukprot:scaffold165522_cov21-Tisochrysis_lutea.AAC.1
MDEQNIRLPALDEYAVGQVYLPRKDALRHKSRTIIESVVQKSKAWGCSIETLGPRGLLPRLCLGLCCAAAVPIGSYRAAAVPGPVLCNSYACGPVGHDLLAWRRVPVDNRSLGPSALSTEPVVEQMFISANGNFSNLQAEQQCIVANCSSAAGFARPSGAMTYLVLRVGDTAHLWHSLWLVWGKLNPAAYGERARACTHTHIPVPLLAFPATGEINTLRGNSNWMRSREGVMACKGLGVPEEVLQSIYPIVPATSSDTGAFDSVLELLTMCGRDIPEGHSVPLSELRLQAHGGACIRLHHAFGVGMNEVVSFMCLSTTDTNAFHILLAQVMMMLVPEAWQNDPLMPQEKKDFYMMASCL